ATGEPVVMPTLDMVLGCYWMTKIEEGLKGEGKIFSGPSEALLAKHFGYVHLKAKIKVRLDSKEELIETSVGRMIFNEPLPEEIDFINKTMNSKELRLLTSQLIDKLGINKTALILDKIKRMGFKYASDSGVSWGMSDLKIPVEKEKWLKEAQKQVELIQGQYNEGLLTDEERKSRVVEIWLSLTERISRKTKDVIDPTGSIFTIFDSGARGSWLQLNQMTGMKGLVINPSGQTIELPIKSSYKEGFNALEYFISTHGGRKGLADTALKTAQAGYLTRRLVDVCQDVVIREKDCGTKKGITVYREDEEDMGNSLASRIFGRIILKKNPMAKSGELISKETAQRIDETGIDKIEVRSVITCQSKDGVCQKCYGYDLGRNELVKIGEAVGIVTAQAIGEPATQLTLRTFHTGGVAGGQDITQGLPRVEEIFEARVPKGRTVISEVDGKVEGIIEKGKQRIIQIKPMESKEKTKILEYSLPLRMTPWVEKGDLISRGQQLAEGHIDLKDLFRVAGQEVVQRYILREVQQIYTFAGENINDKHIEMIIRQMLSRLKVKSSGSTTLLADDIVERSRFERENQEAVKKKKQPALGQQILLGITKVSLSTESFLSAASFIETTRVLINASIQGKEDKLKGLKENVIIGKLIPAGTGLKP
ncbi:MAG: DNA-directed RNA polymerase subunit beta', partial [Candidatus Portnoybacteria bacterium]